MFTSKRSVYAFVLGLVLTITVPGGVSAQGGGGAGAGGGGGGGGGAAAITPLSYRQGIVQQLQANITALSAVRAGRAGAPSHALARATILHQLGMMMSDAFPEGSGGDGSRANPGVWTNAAEFSTRVQAFQTATQGLVDAAIQGNMEQVASAQTTVQQACGACHMQFRGPPPAQ